MKIEKNRGSILKRADSRTPSRPLTESASPTAIYTQAPVRSAAPPKVSSTPATTTTTVKPNPNFVPPASKKNK